MRAQGGGGYLAGGFGTRTRQRQRRRRGVGWGGIQSDPIPPSVCWLDGRGRLEESEEGVAAEMMGFGLGWNSDGNGWLAGRWGQGV